MKINKNNLKFGITLALVVFLFGFSSKRNKSKNVVAQEVIFMDDLPRFIGLDAVNKLLIQKEEELTSIAKETLDLNEMEKRLLENPMIANADVYLTIDGVLKAQVTQRRPIARVASTASYYLDETGQTMPLSELYSARVPIITGEAESHYDALTQLLSALEKDPVMSRQIIGVHVASAQEFYLLPRIHDFRIAIGEVEDLQKKFNNYKAFYQKATKDSTITSYSQINLKFDKQVVATKK
jgi:cell division protein FtsQ